MIKTKIIDKSLILINEIIKYLEKNNKIIL